MTDNPKPDAMRRIPSARDLTVDELLALRDIVSYSFTPINNIDQQKRARLLELGLIQSRMGGLLPTPAGRIVARL